MYKRQPYNRVYAFFDAVDVTKFCVPKLIEIEMISGSFTAGENVRGRMIGGFGANKNSTARIDFRTAQ